ncbi:MAG: hypothetical protein EOO89_19365 [Pedobacter sp.]|nr:MAG: hypothetical protein EOO89_19365 [Pedobacter sp.]
MRVYLENPEEKLRPNALVRATVKTKAKGSGLVVPTSAVWNIGRSSVVWVRGTPAGENSFLFEAREISVGASRGGFTEITSGLSGKELIAKEAGYMIDSESFVRPE